MIAMTTIKGNAIIIIMLERRNMPTTLEQPREEKRSNIKQQEMSKLK
jgi:hypothetical protein